MQSTWQFHFPTRVRFGAGVLSELGSLTAPLGRNALLVTYADKTGLEHVIDAASKSLVQAGVRVVEFAAITADPPPTVARAGADRAVAENVDVVVGLGGGSALDAAKAIAALAKMGGLVWDYTKANPDYRPITAALPIVAVPTTAGTGSEATNVAVFTHDNVGPLPEFSLKAAIFGEVLRPALAVVDPDTTVGSPATLTAACGADALAHAIESVLSKSSNPITNVMAAKAVELLAEHLLQAVDKPRDPRPRGPVALGALLAGAAINTSGVTVAHVLAHGLGGVLHVPHAVAVAIATPAGLRFNARASAAEYVQLAHCCGLRSVAGNDAAERFVDFVGDFLRKLGLPSRARPPADAPVDLLDKLARLALVSTPVAASMNPRPVDEPTLRDLFAQVLES